VGDVYSGYRVIRPTVDPALHGILRAAVGHGLEGGAPWPDEPLSEDLFRHALRFAVRDRLIGVLAEAAIDGTLPLLPDQLDQLTKHHTGSQVQMLNIEQLLLRVADSFGSAGIDFRVLKGAALSHLFYADPSWRTAADLDLLIPSDRFDDAVTTAIKDLDGEQRVPEVRAGFDREFGKESMVRIGPVELDLHRTFVTGPFGLTIDLDDLFDGRTEIAIGGQRVLALSPEHQFLHACYNAALGDYPVRLGSVRDLLLCRRHLEIDLSRIIAKAEHWHGTAVVQRAAELVIEIAGRDVAGGFTELAALSVPRRQAWLLRSYLSPARSYSRPLASLAVIPGARARLRYGWAIVAPSRTYLDSRGWTKSKHFRRAVRRLLGHD